MILECTKGIEQQVHVKCGDTLLMVPSFFELHRLLQKIKMLKTMSLTPQKWPQTVVIMFLSFKGFPSA